MPFANSIVGGVTLVRPAIRSPNYVPGVSGWSINRVGDAEFNDLTVRGTFEGIDYVITEDGIFFYDGTPANGNLSGSWTAADGTDPYGNQYVQGLTVTSTDGSVNISPSDGSIQCIGDAGDILNIAGGSDLNFLTPGEESSSIISRNYPLSHGMGIDSGANSGLGEICAIQVQEGTVFPPTPGNADTNPRLIVFNGNVYQRPAHIYTTGAILKCTLPTSGIPVAETWHTVGTAGNASYASGWSGTTTFPAGSNGPFNPMRYRKDAEDNVWVEGLAVTSTGSTSNLFTLPTGYFNTSKRAQIPANFVVGSTVSPGFVQVTETGIVSATGSISGHTVGVNTLIYINGSFPLGNVG